MRALPTAAALLAAGLLAAGCGDDPASGSKTFADEKFGITFRHPAALERNDDVTLDANAGAAAKATAGLRLTKRNAIILQRFALKVAITPELLPSAQKELDGLFAKIGARDTRKPTRAGTTGGLPSLTYEAQLPAPADERVQLTFVFDGKDEYSINCQWDEEHADAIRSACAEILRTLRPTGS